MVNKKVASLLPAETIDMGGIPIKQPLPTQKVEQVDPFLLLHHARIKPLRDRPAGIQGVGPHPHRGFSPVTFVVEGEIHHRDSRGNSQVAKEGDVQWMHAGAGIIHSERPSEEIVDKHGRQEMIQLWINSPSDKKMLPPEYQYLSAHQMPMISSNEDVSLKLVAGNYGDLSSPINTQSELLIIWGEGQQAQQTISVPSGYNSCLYVIGGSLSIDGYGLVDKEHLVVFDIEGNEIGLKLSDKSQFLVLSGAPINEKVVQQGPFVMNSETEILKAMRDYQMGKMGILIEEDLE